MAKKATKINLFDFKSVQMRAFHMSWFAFFMCFFAWFGIVPFKENIMASIPDMTAAQYKTSWIASIALTVVARIFVGKFCESKGPRLAYTLLLVLCAIPVIGIAFAQNYMQFLICRLCIGCVGASFVITQIHTTMMFASNCVGTANATTAGWGNIGGGAVAVFMPLFSKHILEDVFSVAPIDSWRIAMICSGSFLLLLAAAYYLLTQDTPQGNFKDLPKKEGKKENTMLLALKDYRVWALFVIYGACFGIEITIYGKMAAYLKNEFAVAASTAGTAVLAFALMNLFARTLGGFFGDKCSRRWGLKGLTRYLGALILLEGLFLTLFSFSTALWLAVAMLVLFSLFVQMAEGATFTVVPFVNKKAVGSVAGIVGAGGNAGAVTAGFLFKFFDGTTPYLYIGLAVLASATLALMVRFSQEAEEEAATELNGGETLQPA